MVDLIPDYCHMKFAPIDEVTLFWVRPELNAHAEKSIDSMAPVITIRRDRPRSGHSGPYCCANFTETAPMTSVKCTEGGNFLPSVAH